MTDLNFKNKKHEKIYNVIKRSLEKKGTFDSVDEYLIFMTSFNLVLWEEAKITITRNGYDQETQSGYSQITAHYSVMKNAQADYMKFSTKLGLSPYDRTKLGKIVSDEAQDKSAESWEFGKMKVAN